MKLKNALMSVSLLVAATALNSCGGGGGSSVTYGYYSSPFISATGFVNALNDVDGAPSFDESEIILYTDETVRSATFGQDDWFVIYDAKFDEYKAVSLDYVRALEYYSYYSSNFQTAEEFRDQENSDILAGFIDGDLFGDDYEVVDFNIFDGLYYGRESGFAYEDENETTDVNLMAADAQMKALAQKVSNISYAYKVSPETALSLISLGEKVEVMIKKGADQQELTVEDQQVLLNDIEHLTGATLEEAIVASQDVEKKNELIQRIADKHGDAQAIKTKLLPELFGIK